MFFPEAMTQNFHDFVPKNNANIGFIGTGLMAFRWQKHIKAGYKVRDLIDPKIKLNH